MRGRRRGGGESERGEGGGGEVKVSVDPHPPFSQVVMVWEVSSGQCVRKVGRRGGPPVTSLSWKKVRNTFPHTGTHTHLVHSRPLPTLPQGYLAMGVGNTIAVWGLESQRTLTELRGHEER